MQKQQVVVQVSAHISLKYSSELQLFNRFQTMNSKQRSYQPTPYVFFSCPQSDGLKTSKSFGEYIGIL